MVLLLAKSSFWICEFSEIVMLRIFKKNFWMCVAPMQVSLFYDFKNLNTGLLSNYLSYYYIYKDYMWNCLNIIIIFKSCIKYWQYQEIVFLTYIILSTE